MCPSSHIFLYFRFDYQIGYDNTDAASSILLVVIEFDKYKVQIITAYPIPQSQGLWYESK